MTHTLTKKRHSPAEECGITVKGKNKWMTLIQKRKQKCYIVLLYALATKIMSEKCCCVIDPKKPLTECIGNPEHREYAIKCENLLNNFDDLRAYEARCHDKQPYRYTCYYVSFKHVREEKICFILHFEVQKSDIRICFRVHEYTPKDKLIRPAWEIPERWGITVKYSNYEHNLKRLEEAIDIYLKEIKIPFDNDKLRCRKRYPCG